MTDPYDPTSNHHKMASGAISAGAIDEAVQTVGVRKGQHGNIPL